MYNDELSDETLRLKALYEYGILDSEDEKPYEELAALAAQICKTDIAAITFVDEKRQWFKAKAGDNVKETPREISFCSHTIRYDNFMIVEDARKDVRFADNPDVKGGLKIVSYAGSPIYSITGMKIGAVCVIHPKRKKFGNKETEALKLISGQVTNLLELRLQNKKMKGNLRKFVGEIENSYRSFFDRGPLPEWVYDTETFRVREVNKAALKLYGYTREEFLNLSLGAIRANPDEKKMLQLAKLLKKGRIPAPYITKHKKKDGEIITVEVTLTELFHRKKRLMIATINDLTEKLKLQDQLTETKDKSLVTMNMVMINAREKEREFIGSELHDNVNQLLAGAKLYLELAGTNHGLQDEMIRLSREAVSTAIDEIRKLSKSLVSPELRRQSLLENIEDLINTFTASKKMIMHFSHRGDVENLPEEIKLSFFRIIQEQMNNIVKYSEAANVWIAIKYDQSVELTVRDDGKGFDTKAKKSGIGLNNIRKRAESFGGTAVIISSPGSGCYVSVTIPKEYFLGTSKID